MSTVRYVKRQAVHSMFVVIIFLFCSADATFQHMFVVYATGQYIGAPNENGGVCETVTFQQSCK